MKKIYICILVEYKCCNTSARRCKILTRSPQPTDLWVLKSSKQTQRVALLGAVFMSNDH